jgi:hypothetical protein
VLDVGEVRLRWIGHQIRARCEVDLIDKITGFAIRYNRTARPWT